MTKYFIDTETCGLHGLAVLIQYAIDDGPIQLHSVWTEPAIDTLRLIEEMANNEVIGFNLSYDWFHLCKLYTIFSLLKDVNAYPEDCIDEIAELEPLGRDGFCLKPKSACDLMLYARKGPYQSTMDRGDIRIRKIPAQIVFDVRDALEERVKFEDIYFARRKDKYGPKWQVFDREDDPDFKDIVLKFKASSALKNLAIHALKLNPAEVLRFGDIEVEKEFWPLDVGYAPYAKALSSAKKHWRVVIKSKNKKQIGYAWPRVIHRHISHWTSNKLARQYAEDDVKYTRGLWVAFGKPECGDDDSVLACMVGAVRWKGFKIDTDGIKELKEKAIQKIAETPMAPGPVSSYLSSVMDEVEKSVLYNEDTKRITTKKIILEEIAKWKIECPRCNTASDEFNEEILQGYKADSALLKLLRDECEVCLGTGLVKHPAASRAQEVLDARQAKSEIDLFNKLLCAGRFHASFVVIGTLSSRMSGSGGDLNPQGIKRGEEIRSRFPLAFDPYILCGGDFVSFEVVLADAVYNDPLLRKDLQSGKKIHALFGMEVFPDKTYEEILADKELYTRSKNGVFAMLYGGEAHTLKTRLGVEIETAEKAYQKFITKYKQVGVARKQVFDMFCSMRQPGGIGTAVEWHQPSDYISSIFGFRRYFTLENQVCRTLFDMASKPPKHWANYRGKVTRRDRVQTVSGAVQSALYAAAFAIQASSMRAAANHVIQCSGAQITKKVQRNIWELQPHGIHPWLVQPMNIHDEIMCPTKKEVVELLNKTVKETVESFRPQVPLIEIGWHSGLKSWAEK